MVIFSQHHMERERLRAAEEVDPVTEFRRAMEDWDRVMKRLIEATIKMSAARTTPDAKHNW